MKPEIEAKFLNVDFDDIRAKLIRLGAKCITPMRMMRRVVFDHQDDRLRSEHAWVRVRDEGDKITLTYKQTEEKSFGGAKEIELHIDNYEKALDFFVAIGMKQLSDQETMRETWRLGDAEVVLDEWPWLNPFIEIEAATKTAVQTTANNLGLAWNDAVFGSVTTAYRLQYPAITADDHISKIERIKFDEPMPEWFTKEG